MNKKHKPVFKLPKPEANKILNTAFGRGMAEAIAEKQARIDRLERLIWMVHENVVRGVKSSIIDDDDVETSLCVAIIAEVKRIKSQ